MSLTLRARRVVLGAVGCAVASVVACTSPQGVHVGPADSGPDGTTLLANLDATTADTPDGDTASDSEVGSEPNGDQGATEASVGDARSDGAGPDAAIGDAAADAAVRDAGLDATVGDAAPDAAAGDAGLDAGPPACVAAASCTLSNECEIGRISCTSGSPSCESAGNVQDGTACGSPDSGLLCTQGQCTCAASQHFCSPSCVSLADPAACGSDCTACPTPSNGGTATCDLGAQCGAICGGTPCGPTGNDCDSNQQCVCGTSGMPCNGNCVFNGSIYVCCTDTIYASCSTSDPTFCPSGERCIAPGGGAGDGYCCPSF